MAQIFFTDYAADGNEELLVVRDFGWHNMQTNVDRSEGIGPFYQILLSVNGNGHAFHHDLLAELPPSTLLFARPNETLGYASVTDAWETVFIVFDGVLAKGLTENIDSGVYEFEGELTANAVRNILEMPETLREDMAGALLYSILLSLSERKPLLSVNAQQKKGGVYAARD